MDRRFALKGSVAAMLLAGMAASHAGPVTDEMLVSDDGWVWLRRVDGYPLRRAVLRGRFQRERAQPAGSTDAASRPPDRWDIFQPDGAYAGHVILPVDFEPLSVRGNRIAGYTIDEDDVEYPTVLQAGP